MAIIIQRFLCSPLLIPLCRNSPLKVKLASETGGVVCHLDASPVKVGDGRDKAEAEAVARALPATLEAIKPPEDVLAFLNRNSRAAIGNRKNGSIGAVRDGDRNLSVSFAAVLDRIIYKVGDGVEQQIPVADHIHPSACNKL